MRTTYTLIHTLSTAESPGTTSSLPCVVQLLKLLFQLQTPSSNLTSVCSSLLRFLARSRVPVKTGPRDHAARGSSDGGFRSARNAVGRGTLGGRDSLVCSSCGTLQVLLVASDRRKGKNSVATGHALVREQTYVSASVRPDRCARSAVCFDILPATGHSTC
jgi:hypothetical protein